MTKLDKLDYILILLSVLLSLVASEITTSECDDFSKFMEGIELSSYENCVIDDAGRITEL